MPITAIARDWGPNLSIVRMLTTDSLADVQVSGYLLAQQAAIDALNGGTFQWAETDYVFIKASDGWGQFNISADFDSLSLFALAGGGGGVVTAAQVQQSEFNYSVDTGIDGVSYVGEITPVPASLTDGLTVIFLPNNINTVNNPTFELNGLGAYPINGQTIVGLGDISPVNLAMLTWNDSQTEWVLQNPLSTLNVAFYQNQGRFNYSEDSGAANAYVGVSNNFPTLGSVQAGTYVFLLVTNSNSGPSTFSYNDSSALNIIFNNAVLTGGEMLGSRISLLCFDGTLWQLINSYNISGGSVTAADIQQQSFTFAVDTGAADAYVIDLTPAVSSYTEPLTVWFRATNSNAGNSTIEINGNGAAGIVLNDNSSLVGGEILAGGDYILIYNGVSFVLINPTASSGGVTDIQVQQSAFNIGIDSGAADAYVVATTPAISAYTNGLTVIFNPANTNTGASTLDAGAGAATIVKSGVPGSLANLTAADMKNNVNAICMYLETFNLWFLVNPAVTPVTTGGTDSVQGGTGAAAAGTSSLAIGNNAQASGNSSLAVGQGANATGDSSVSLGHNSAGTGISAIGIVGVASADYAIAIGDSTQATAEGALALGRGATASNNYAVVIGNLAQSNAQYSLALGYRAHPLNTGSCSMTDSNGSVYPDSANDQHVTTFAGGYRFALNASTLAFSVDTAANLINNKGTADQSYSLQAPSTGFTITIGAGVKSLILNPAGTLATGTITMPAAPVDGQEIRFSSSQIVTALTVSPNAGQTLSNAPVAFAAGQGYAFIYNLSGTNWYRLY